MVQRGGFASLKQQRIVSLPKSTESVPRELTNANVLVCSDNTTTVACINKQGGTKSRELTKMAWKFLTLADQLNCQLQARHVPGRLNVLADVLSR